MGKNEKAWHVGFKWTIGNEDVPAGALAVDNTSRQLHICDIDDVDTDWNVPVASHPELYIHSVTTPETNYLKLYQTGSSGIIDVGGTTVFTLTSSTIATALPFSSTYSGGTAIAVTVTAGDTDSLFGIRLQNTFTKNDGGSFKGISSELTYTPSTGSGYSAMYALGGKVSLAGNFTGGTGHIWAIQGNLDLGTSNTINNAASVLSGVRGVITGSSITFTDADGICCFYADNLCLSDMAGMSTGETSFFRAQNTTGSVDNFLHIWGSNDVHNFVSFESVAGTPPMVSGGGATHSGTIKKVRCLLDGQLYYFTISTSVS